MKDSTKEGLDAHRDIGQPVGDFLTAVLSNQLSAILLADDENQRDIVEIIQYVYGEMPHNAWGSRENVIKWRNHGGLRGLERELAEQS